ncbi:MAG TPA: ornithine cyclodeaminase family protein [Steroidobacteraceae bacterium]|nr:ornithine cyclodeaminase family protein [Steroidobacteraceae bacterium]
MRVIDAGEVLARSPWPALIDCLEEAFRVPPFVPLRQVLAPPGGTGDRHFFIMPAFAEDGTAAVKLITYLPENARRNLPTIQAAIVVFSAEGVPLALIDGTMVTRLRTAAASALASRYLSRPDSRRLALAGTGALAPWMAAAHAVERPIERIDVWGRRPERAQATVEAIRPLVGADVDVRAAASFEAAVREADIVSCATSSRAPLLEGRWLSPGAFVDLVGSFTPDTRESDDEAVRRSRIFVDTFEGTLAEAGDLIDPIARGIVRREQVEGELADLVSGRVPGRRTTEEITLYKSVGTAIADLAAARLVTSAVD